eukprot:TRINITY_DN24331_c0_g1_i1.p1 TRINITY_DN24331_c0_g1~~TRINITY_DN24331_c0_g1_i1.p1  ORF type:complete len:399 (+),score=102.66 TRINITY_DN24331_c0_g1_i1:58-1197(+)
MEPEVTASSAAPAPAPESVPVPEPVQSATSASAPAQSTAPSQAADSSAAAVAPAASAPDARDSSAEEVELLRERIEALESRNARLLDEIGVLRGRAEIDAPHWQAQLGKCAAVLEREIAPFRGAPLGERLANVLNFLVEVQDGLRSMGGTALREEKDALKEAFAQHMADFDKKKAEMEAERAQMQRKNEMLRGMVTESEAKFQAMETYWQEQCQAAYHAGLEKGGQASTASAAEAATTANGGAPAEAPQAAPPREAPAHSSQQVRVVEGVVHVQVLVPESVRSCEEMLKIMSRVLPIASEQDAERMVELAGSARRLGDEVVEGPAGSIDKRLKDRCERIQCLKNEFFELVQAVIARLEKGNDGQAAAAQAPASSSSPET